MELANEYRFDVLKRKALLLQHENRRLVEEVIRMRKEILELKGLAPEVLQQELALLEQKLAESLAALDATEETSEDEGHAPPKRPRKKTGGHGPRPQPQLPIQEVVHDLDEADKKCVTCGGDVGAWEGQDDVTEEIDVIERTFVIKKHVRKKYRCRCGCIEMAQMPARLVPGGRYSNAFAVEVATMKYVDQIPLDRICGIFEREGVVVESQTLWDQVYALGVRLAPAHARLRTEALKEPIIGLDQTHWKVIGHAKSWQMWELSTALIAYFDIAKSKDHKEGGRILDGFRGTVVCDAAQTHRAVANLLGDIQLAHCWAHPRRYAEDALASDPSRAKVLIGLIRELYDVEDDGAGDLEKLGQLRQTRSRAVLDRIESWRKEQRVLPSSPMGQLLGYLANNWTGFQRFLEDPRIPIDNNHTERGYLWPAIGRRSYTGTKSQRGTHVAAVFFSLTESARRNDVDPKRYLRTALDAALAGETIPLPHELPSPDQIPVPGP